MQVGFQITFVRGPDDHQHAHAGPRGQNDGTNGVRNVCGGGRGDGRSGRGGRLRGLGLGRIGKLVADRAKGFGMRLVAYDPFVSEDRAKKMGVELLALDQQRFVFQSAAHAAVIADADLDLAREILADRALHARALASTSTLATAQRSPRRMVRLKPS